MQRTANDECRKSFRHAEGRERERDPKSTEKQDASSAIIFSEARPIEDGTGFADQGKCVLEIVRRIGRLS